MEKEIKRIKTESRQESPGLHRYIVPNTWFKKENHPKVMLLLLARKFCDEPQNPFYCDVFPRELFCRVMTFLASRKRLEHLVIRSELQNEWDAIGKEHYLLAQIYRNELENVQTELTGTAWQYLGYAMYDKDDYEKSTKYLKRAFEYKNGKCKAIFMTLLHIAINIRDSQKFDEYAEEFARFIQENKEDDTEKEYALIELEFSRAKMDYDLDRKSANETLEKYLDLIDRIEKIGFLGMTVVEKNIRRQAMVTYMNQRKWGKALSLFHTLPLSTNQYSYKDHAAKCYFMQGKYEMAMEKQLDYCTDAEGNFPDKFPKGLDLYYQYSKVNAKKMIPDKIKWD